MSHTKKKIAAAIASSALIFSVMTPAAFAGNNSHDGNHWMGHGHHHGSKLNTRMTGSQEVPGPGDPDGKGKAHVRLNVSDDELCVKMRVKNIDPADKAHIHKAPKGEAGPVVVNLPVPNAEGFAEGCVSVDENTLNDIKENPSEYYVNVHNPAYPDGAVRGQL